MILSVVHLPRQNLRDEVKRRLRASEAKEHDEQASISGITQNTSTDETTPPVYLHLLT